MISVPLATRNIPWCQGPWVQILFELLWALTVCTCLWRSAVSECSTTLGLGMPALNTLPCSRPSQLSRVNRVQLGISFFTLERSGKGHCEGISVRWKLSKPLASIPDFWCLLLQQRIKLHVECCNCSHFAFPTGLENFLRLFPVFFKFKFLGNILMNKLQNMLNWCIFLNLIEAHLNRVQQTSSP